MEQTVFYFIIGILIIDYLFEQFLEYLNFTKLKSVLPNELAGIYDNEKYSKSVEYDKVNYRFSIITSSFNLLFFLFFLYFSGFTFVDNIARSYSVNPIIVALIFFGLIMIFFDILQTPFNYYDTFKIEERFGFNKTKVSTFFIDKIKSWLIGAAIGGPLLAVIIWIYTLTETHFWFYSWIVISLFIVFITIFYTTLIVPFFNKLKSLEEGDLKSEIINFCKRVNFNLDNVFVIDGSKRSTKGNAYFSGLGKRKKIVLFDTLIEKLSKEEIIAVLSHEIGHYKKSHILMALINSIIQTGLTLYVLSFFIGNPVLAKALGSDLPSFHLGLITFGFLYSPISMVLGLFSNIISRKNEYAADRFSAQVYEGKYLQSALKKLSVDSLSNLTPHPLYVFFKYSHPTLLQRIKFIEKNTKNES